jgi:thymidine kinase
MHLTLLLGPMFAGKSSALLARVRRAKTLGWPVLLLTSSLDKRYSESGHEIMTHDKDSLTAVGVHMLKGVASREDYKAAKLVVIEESQFFPDLYDFVVMAVEQDKKSVVVVGLDGDSDRRPFGDILRLVPLADEIVKLTALCKRCGDGTAALFSALLPSGGEKSAQICVGGAERYEPMCRRHYLDNQAIRMVRNESNE